MGVAAQGEVVDAINANDAVFRGGGREEESSGGCYMDKGDNGGEDRISLWGWCCLQKCTKEMIWKGAFELKIHKC